MRGRLIALAAVGALVGVGASSSGAEPSGNSATRRPAFSITGSVAGLLPGRAARLRIAVRNRNAFPLRVTTISVRVRGTAACPASNLLVRNFRGRVLVRPRATRRVAVLITLRADAPDACQGARFRLTYRGKAVRS